MAIAITLKDYLRTHQADFDVVTHPHSGSSMETAAAAHVPGDWLAKSVLLKDDLGYLMALLPSTCHVAVGALNRRIGRNLHLASEWELGELFRDCEPGAVPAIGPAYGLKTVVDERLIAHREIYFEAGDHKRLIHMRVENFLDLLGEAERVEFARHM